MLRRCSLFMMMLAVASMAIGSVDAFQSSPLPSPLTASMAKDEYTSSDFVLHAFKPPSLKKKTAEPPAEKVKSSNALDLIILYMTPWRNPNSIFVYIFIILFALGKYSEAQSAAGNM